MRRLALAGVALMLCFGIGLGTCAAVVASAVSGTSPTPTGSAAAAVASLGAQAGTPAIPPSWESIETGAASTCHGLEWSVLGAIGRIESDSGRSTLPGVASSANAYGAEVIYRWDGGLWRLRHEITGGRGSLVSEGSLARGQGGGHSGFIGSPAHDDQISSVASGVTV